MVLRYALGAKGQVSYGIEGTPYTVAATPTNYIGLVEEDVTFPQGNPQKVHANGGTRKPYAFSPEELDLQFDVPFTFLDGNPPLEIAFGQRVTTVNQGAGAATTIAVASNGQSLPQATINVADASGFNAAGGKALVTTGAGVQIVSYTGKTGTTLTGCTGGSGAMATGGAVQNATYQEDVFSYADVLPTATFQRNQSDIQLQDQVIGCKASFEMSWRAGEVVKGKLGVLGASRPAPSVVSSLPAINTPSNRVPFRALHLGDVTLTKTSDQSAVKTVSTVVGGTLGVDAGLKANQHGKGRGNYSISEEAEAASLFKAKLTVNVIDTDLYLRSVTDDVLIDAKIPFDVDLGYGASYTRGMVATLTGCKVIDAPIPKKINGVLQSEITLSPTDFGLKIRTPIP